LNVSELRNSSERIGQLYPILLDSYGNIIDGEHRSKADSNWRKIRLKHINTKKDLLIARFACNNLRRSTTTAEKRELLTKLAEISLREGIPIGKIAYELMNQTGMSYRWVTKYLPQKFKDGKHIHKRNIEKKNFVARHATNCLDLAELSKDPLKLLVYRNTDFVNLVMKKKLFLKLEKKANELGIPVTTLILKGIQKALS
jgi:hypothetical protein